MRVSFSRRLQPPLLGQRLGYLNLSLLTHKILKNKRLLPTDNALPPPASRSSQEMQKI